MRTFLIISAALFLVACSASRLATPTAVDVEKGSANFEALTLSQLESGKVLYSENCGKCHPHKKVGNYTREEWERIMPDMVQKANKKGGNLVDADEEALLRYAVTMAQ